MTKLSDTDIQNYVDSRTINQEEITALQVSVYVMCGGGWLGQSAAERPADFYIDTRTGRLPYSVKEIIQVVRTLARIAESIGLNSHEMPKLPHFHHMGIF